MVLIYNVSALCRIRSFWVHIQQTLQVDHVLVLASKYMFIFIFIPFIALQFQKKNMQNATPNLIEMSSWQ